MTALNCLSLFLAGLSAGILIACMRDRDYKWAGIFGAITAFNLLIAFVSTLA